MILTMKHFTAFQSGFPLSESSVDFTALLLNTKGNVAGTYRGGAEGITGVI